MRPLLSTKPVATFVLNAVNTPVDTVTWKQISAKVLVAGTSVEIFNSTGSTLQISQGTAGNEATALLPYTIPQGGSAFQLPMEISSGKPLSLLALDANSSVGLVVINLFG